MLHGPDLARGNKQTDVITLVRKDTPNDLIRIAETGVIFAYVRNGWESQ